MKNAKEKGKHRFLDKHPVAGAILLALYGYFFALIIVSIVEWAVPAEGLGRIIGAVAGSMIILAIHKHWFRPEFEGNLRGGKPSEGFSMFRIFAVFWAVSLFVQVFVAKFEWGPPTISTIAVSITAGFCEETVFRGLPLSLLMRRFARDRNMIAALIITSAVFGLTHGLNIFAGANAQRTVLQIIGAGFLGLLLGAVYLRSGSLWPVIVIHTAHDIIAFMDVSNVSETGVIIGKVTWQSYFDLGLGIAMGIIGIWLVRKARRDEIREIWEKKWRIRENEENAGYN